MLETWLHFGLHEDAYEGKRRSNIIMIYSINELTTLSQRKVWLMSDVRCFCCCCQLAPQPPFSTPSGERCLPTSHSSCFRLILIRMSSSFLHRGPQLHCSAKDTTTFSNCAQRRKAWREQVATTPASHTGTESYSYWFCYSLRMLHSDIEARINVL